MGGGGFEVQDLRLVEDSIRLGVLTRPEGEHPLQHDPSIVVVLGSGGRLNCHAPWGAIWIAPSGGFVAEFAGHAFRCRSGVCLVSEARREVAIQVDDRRESVVIGIIPSRAMLDGQLADAGTWIDQCRVLLPEIDWPVSPGMGMALSSLAGLQDLRAASPMIRGWAATLLRDCIDHQAAARGWIGRCAGRTRAKKEAMLGRLLRARLVLLSMAEPNVDAGARAALLSKWRFIMRYREVFGRTPLADVQAYRLDKARELIQSGTWAISDVAEAVGYRNRSSFSRAFSERFGVAPGRIASQVRSAMRSRIVLAERAAAER